VTEDNVELVKRGIEAFNRRDFDAALALAAEDISWEPFLSRAETEQPLVGHDAIRAAWESQTEAVDLRIEAAEYIPVGADKVVVPARLLAHGRASDAFVEESVAWLFRATDGLLWSVEVFEDSAAAIAAAERS
jgi:ketosteroid isomerase-like protein